MPITGVSYRRTNGVLEPIDILKEGTAMAARKTQLSTRKETDVNKLEESVTRKSDVISSAVESIQLNTASYFDNVTNPDHYTDGRKYEPRKVIMDWDLNFYLGNVVKYISRAGRKGDGLTDLLKAKQYLEWEIERLTEKEEN